MNNTNRSSKLKYCGFTLWRYKLFIITFVVAACVCVFSYSHFVTSIYEARTSLLISNEKNISVYDEARLIKSPEFAEKIINDLNLKEDEEFSEDPKNPAKIIENFQKNLDLDTTNQSYMIDIKFRSIHPEKAAYISNKIAQTYIDLKSAVKKRSDDQLNRWVKIYLNDLKSKIEKQQNDLILFEQNNNINSSDSASVLNNVKPQNKNLSFLENELAKAKKALASLETWSRNIDEIDNVNLIDNSALLDGLRLKRITAQNNISKLSLKYGERHPDLIAAKADLKLIEKDIRNELLNLSAVYSKRIKSTEAKIKQEEKTNDPVTPVQVQWQKLKDDLKLQKDILNQFLKKYQYTQMLPKPDQYQTRIITPASIPMYPTYPDRAKWIKCTALLSFLTALILVFLLEKIRTTYRTIEELESETGLSCLSLISYVIPLNPSMKLIDYILSQEGTRLAEAVRTLRMILKLRAKNNDSVSKVVAITSSLPEEGKTTLSAWMARVSAKSGERVIVLDCDLRRPRLHEAFGQKPDNTIVEYLTGNCTLEEAIFREHGTNMHAIFGRSVPNNALDLITKDRMKNLIHALRERYDLIILDSPACLSVSDARLLCSYADQTLYAVSWNDTSREVVNAGLKQFADIGCDGLALVLTNVDMKSYAKYGFNDAVHYYSAYNSYYAD